LLGSAREVSEILEKGTVCKADVPITKKFVPPAGSISIFTHLSPVSHGMIEKFPLFTLPSPITRLNMPYGFVFTKCVST
jgi:hypothetical protein